MNWLEFLHLLSKQDLCFVVYIQFVFFNSSCGLCLVTNTYLCESLLPGAYVLVLVYITLLPIIEAWDFDLEDKFSTISAMIFFWWEKRGWVGGVGFRTPGSLTLYGVDHFKIHVRSL